MVVIGKLGKSQGKRNLIILVEQVFITKNKRQNKGDKNYFLMNCMYINDWLSIISLVLLAVIFYHNWLLISCSIGKERLVYKIDEKDIEWYQNRLPQLFKNK